MLQNHVFPKQPERAVTNPSRVQGQGGSLRCAGQHYGVTGSAHFPQLARGSRTAATSGCRGQHSEFPGLEPHRPTHSTHRDGVPGPKRPEHRGDVDACPGNTGHCLPPHRDLKGRGSVRELKLAPQCHTPESDRKTCDQHAGGVLLIHGCMDREGIHQTP